VCQFAIAIKLKQICYLDAWSESDTQLSSGLRVRSLEILWNDIAMANKWRQCLPTKIPLVHIINPLTYGSHIFSLIISSILFLQPWTFHVPNFKVLFLSLSWLSPSDFRGLVFGFLAFIFLVMSEELACCYNPQPGGPGDFWSRFSFSCHWYINIKQPGKKNVDGRSTSSHGNKNFRTRSMDKQRGMAFSFRKTATAVKNQTDR